jgi:hypothetical protein
MPKDVLLNGVRIGPMKLHQGFLANKQKIKFEEFISIAYKKWLQ